MGVNNSGMTHLVASPHPDLPLCGGQPLGFWIVAEDVPEVIPLWCEFLDLVDVREMSYFTTTPANIDTIHEEVISLKKKNQWGTQIISIIKKHYHKHTHTHTYRGIKEGNSYSTKIVYLLTMTTINKASPSLTILSPLHTTTPTSFSLTSHPAHPSTRSRVSWLWGGDGHIIAP